MGGGEEGEVGVGGGGNGGYRDTFILKGEEVRTDRACNVVSIVS